MKKAAIVFLLAGVIFACNQNQNDDGVGSPSPSADNMIFCDSGSANSLCSYLPIDVDTSFSVGYDSDLDSARQRLFDMFSWQTFVALNWPSNAAGQPIGSGIESYPDSARVWETYQDPAQVFNTSTQQLMLHLGSAKQDGIKFFYMDSKAPQALSSIHGFKEADGHPLIDRNLNFTLYEIKMNPTEVKFVTTYKLTTKDSIYSYWASHNNEFNLPASDSATGDPGTIEVKASWRMLYPAQGDDTSRFYCRNALVYIDSAHTVNGKPLLIKVKVGLVGMHIVRKTAKFGVRQIWSTFEHIDNTPDNAQEAQMNTKKKWSYYNQLCLNCVPNDTPAFQVGDNQVYKWDSAAPYAARYAVSAPSQPALGKFGTQAVRVYPIYYYTEKINQAWRAKLKGSVWANYRLIGSQWQLAESFPPPNAPAMLGNTTLETYIQPTASCITCHGDFAAINFKGNKILTDMSFIFPVYAK
jgi:hypothetical protein